LRKNFQKNFIKSLINKMANHIISSKNLYVF